MEKRRFEELLPRSQSAEPQKQFSRTCSPSKASAIKQKFCKPPLFLQTIPHKNWLLKTESKSTFFLIIWDLGLSPITHKFLVTPLVEISVNRMFSISGTWKIHFCDAEYQLVTVICCVSFEQIDFSKRKIND